MSDMNALLGALLTEEDEWRSTDMRDTWYPLSPIPEVEEDNKEFALNNEHQSGEHRQDRNNNTGPIVPTGTSFSKELCQLPSRSSPTAQEHLVPSAPQLKREKKKRKKTVSVGTQVRGQMFTRKKSASRKKTTAGSQNKENICTTRGKGKKESQNIKEPITLAGKSALPPPLSPMSEVTDTTNTHTGFAEDEDFYPTEHETSSFGVPSISSEPEISPELQSQPSTSQGGSTTRSSNGNCRSIALDTSELSNSKDLIIKILPRGTKKSKSARHSNEEAQQLVVNSANGQITVSFEHNKPSEARSKHSKSKKSSKVKKRRSEVKKIRRRRRRDTSSSSSCSSDSCCSCSTSDCSCSDCASTSSSSSDYPSSESSGF